MEKDKTPEVAKKTKEKIPGTSPIPEVKFHMWLEKDGGVFFGCGRYELLLKIEELGSLKLASENLGLSYRGAWGKIKRTEEIIGQKLIYKKNNKEGYMLTDFGRGLMTEFGEFYEDVFAYASKKSTKNLNRFFETVENQE
ncbi:MAG: LysR family transcriptional regulator [Spirochaetota bacterium]